MPRMTLLLIMAVAVTLSVAAQTATDDATDSDDSLSDEESLFAQDEDDLFGGGDDDLFQGDLIEEGDESGSPDSGVDDLLTSDAPTVGGTFDFSVRLSADPDGFDPSTSDSWDSVDRSYSLSPTVFVDARPDPDFRVFIKTGIDYTTDRADPGASITVEEIFSDVTLADWLYMRAGKQNMTWGVGYFFSPADLLSLESIDPDDPEAQREGPVAVRLHLPEMTTNYYAYAVLDDLPNTGHAGYAGKVEFVVGNHEFTTGGYFEQDAVSGIMATWSGSIGDFDVFAEGVAQYGSTITLVEESGPVLVTDEREGTWFPLATAGARYSWSDDGGNFDLTFLGQYYYNGEGYEDPNILTDKRIDLLLLSGDISPADLSGTGRHYAGASARWSGAFDSDLSPSAYWVGNLTDGSGLVAVDLAWRINDYLRLTPGYSYTYGDEREEYAFAGTGHRINIRASLGTGGF